MRILMTGATGFLGRHLVREFLGLGDQVRVLTRFVPFPQPPHQEDIEIFQSDIKDKPRLVKALEGVDVVVHLAAAMSGDDEIRQFQHTVVYTQNLLEAMAALPRPRRFVLASSLSVYDWEKSKKVLDENSPLETNPYRRDGYAQAKCWQERLARRYAQRDGWELTILRPGFIWGPGREFIHGLGQRVGNLFFVIGGGRRLPVTHVENCARIFAKAAREPKAAGQVFNVVDEPVGVWHYTSKYLSFKKEGMVRILVPYCICEAMVHAVYFASQLIFKRTGKLPSILVPCRFKARFKPLHFSRAKLKRFFS